MNDNSNNGVKIEIEECNCSKERFDENSENRALYNVKISSEGRKQSFTIKAQTVKVPNLTFKRRKITITDNKNTSMTYFIDGKKEHIKGTNDTSNDLKKINNNDDINTIIDVLEHNNNIEQKKQSINLCFKSDDGNTYECNEYEKYKPYNYKIVSENSLNSCGNRWFEKVKAYVFSNIIENIFYKFKNIAHSYNQVAKICLECIPRNKKLFK